MESPKRAKLEKLFSAEGIILEAQLAHILGRKQVSTVDDELASHEAPCTLPDQFAKGITLGRDQRGIRVAERIVGIFAIVQLGNQSFRPGHGYGVAGLNDDAFLAEPLGT